MFADEFSGYYVSALSAPSLVLFDLNDDGIKDIIIWVQDISNIGIGMTQNAYISNGTGYTELGSMTWNMNAETHAFGYSVALCDDYIVHLSIPAYKIDTYVPMDEEFATVATDFGILNKKRKNTEYGLEWTSGDNPYQAPFETKLECGISENGEFVLRTYAPIRAEYSSYKLGADLIEDWKIIDGGYELTEIYV